MSTSEDLHMRCALIGADTLLVECGNQLLERGHDLVVVAASDMVRQWATGRGLVVLDGTQPVSEWQPELAERGIDWLFAITYLAQLPAEVVQLPARGAVNFHDGPLPAYGGLNAPAWAIIDGEARYGVTWHLMDAGIDTGDVVLAPSFDVADGETSLSLNTRNFEAAIDSFGELMDQLENSSHQPVPQDPSAPRRTFTSQDRPGAMAVLDWSRPAAQLDRLVRALTFGPYPNPLGVAKVRGGDEVVAVGSAEVVELADRDVLPGTVLDVDGRLVVACAEDGLSISSFATLRGAPLTLEEVIEALGIELGSTLTELDDEARARLDQLGGQLARVERRQLTRMRSIEPAELPWARTAQAGHVPDWSSASLEVPSETARQPGAVATALAVLLSRLGGKDRFNVSLVDSAWFDTLGEERRFVLDDVAIGLAVDPDVSLAAVRGVVGDELTAARADLPPAAELVARYPEFSQSHELVSGRSLPVVLRLGATGAPREGAVVEVVQDDGGWTIRHDAALIADDDSALLRSCLESVLRSLDRDDTVLVRDVDLLGPELRQQILESWNDTERPVPDTTIPQLFEQQVDRTPDEVAVVFEDAQLTYRELDDAANRLAHHLVELGVRPESLVGVHVGRGIELITTVLAVHKAGGAYVPLDPLYPANRLDHMIADSGCSVVVTESRHLEALPRQDDPEIHVVVVDRDRELIDRCPSLRLDSGLVPGNLAYCIYTSGSTGLPKGVLVEHRNVVNFFVGMDERVPHETPATWFAVTSLSFDISVLELLYTVTRGFSVVVYLDRERGDQPDAVGEQHATRPMDFSLFYFSGDAAQGAGPGKYQLLLDGARFADTHDFHAVWTPERHFHDFGGLYPQPAVTSAAVAAVTERVGIRAGSVVMPLEHPIRVAEAWSVVDNLSDGRVGISFASGWQPNDFVLRPENYPIAKQAMFDGIEQVQRLWRGETVSFDGATADPVEVRTLPRPVQPEVPTWVTTAGNPETYVQAGRIGANVLTHLLGQSVEQLAPKIEAYRAARAEAGFDPSTGVVTLMLHTFVGDDEDQVRDLVRGPMKEYLGTSFSLLREYAWSYPAFQRPAGSSESGDLSDEAFVNLAEEDLDAVLEFAFLRYYETSGLFGTVGRCRTMVDELKGIGVDEVACLIDFGLDVDTVLESLPTLDRLRVACNSGVEFVGADVALDQSVAAQLTRHGVTHLQCTPSMARMWSLQDDTREALGGVRHLFIGGEAFPPALAADLRAASRSGEVTNMYGPTETTIWSTTWPLSDDLVSVPIGFPIANTRIYVLDQLGQPVPPGVAGELWIGGRGVVRGYHERPELTAERFVPDPFVGGEARMYHTGDLARWRPQSDGRALLEFLGRIDHQVKIRGYRIELGEIEAQLGRMPGVRECVAIVREDTPGDQQLVSYVSAASGSTLDGAEIKNQLRATLPEVMVPAHVVLLDDLPHTPNGKLDRNALPSLADVLGSRRPTRVDATNEIERQVLSVWEETLGRTGIGIDDNFFDIGGHSLLIVRMHRRLKAELDRPLALTDLYRHPTVRSFADSLSGDGAEMLKQSSVDRAARRREQLQRRRARR